MLLFSTVALALGALPPGPGPFGTDLLPQPVYGAPRGGTPDGWKQGKLCDVSKAPYLASSGTNATAALQQAIADCGNLPGGGTVLVPAPLTLLTASLWMQSNLTLRVEEGATLLGTATGTGDTAASIDDAPLVYTRRNALMVTARAGLINGGRCVQVRANSIKAARCNSPAMFAHDVSLSHRVQYKDPLVGWDDCDEWSKLENVVIEGGGTLDANGMDWWVVQRCSCEPLLFNRSPCRCCEGTSNTARSMTTTPAP
jgi:hypothetical protein